MRRDVTFRSGGVNCSGWLYAPAGHQTGERHPAIVMAHGFAGVKEAYLAGFAERFAAAGLVTLVFDYRYLGASAGEPRQQVIPAEQHEDYRNAITWVSQQPEVDPNRIGIWGTSFSGGHVLHLAAFDRRIKAAVAQSPTINGWEAARRRSSADQFERTLAAMAQERVRRYREGTHSYVKIVAPEGEPAHSQDPEARAFFSHLADTVPTWRNEITLDSLEKALEYAPAANIHLISPTPLLMIVPERDAIIQTDLALAAYNAALEPKALVMIPGGHFAVHSDPGFSLAVQAAVDWFRQHLRPEAVGS